MEQPPRSLQFTVYGSQDAMWFDRFLLESGVRYVDWSDRDYKGKPVLWHFRIPEEGESP